MSLNHAAHNENFCHMLLSRKTFSDWVITGAFYSALHYADYELFPLKFGSHSYPDFDKYYRIFKMNRDNKHDARQRLIYSNINPSAGAAYHWLKLNCWSARYYEYMFDETEADLAVEKLLIIKSHISKLVNQGLT